MASPQPPNKAPCCICGHSTCEETYDHAHITSKQLQSVLQESRSQMPALVELQAQVERYYARLRQRVAEMIEEDRKGVLMAIRKLEFPYMEKEKVSMELLSRVVEGDFSEVPTRRLIPILDALDRPHEDADTPDQPSPVEHVLLEQCSLDGLQAKLASLNQALLLAHVKQQEENTLALRRTVSIRKLRKLQQQPVKENNSFELKGVRCLENCREIQLNNKNITDSDLFDPVRNMQYFNNLVSLELRNNKITEISCRLIAVSLNNLHRLDIRGNKLKDNSMNMIAKRLTKLKELFVCDNQLSDLSMEAIVESIKGLTLIWLQNNQVTYRGAERIIHHEKVKAIGLMGNRISHEQASQLRHQFTCGYLSI